MFNDVFKTNKAYILALAVVYGVILSFPVFGPVLNNIAGSNESIKYGSTFLFVFLLNFLAKPQEFENRKYYIKGLLLISAITALTFSIQTVLIRYVSMVILGIALGRYVVLWCYWYTNDILEKDISASFSLIIMLGYSILYISNLLNPGFIPLASSIWAGLFLIIACFFFANIETPHIFKHSNKNLGIKKYWRILLIIFFVYLTAGAAYTDIYFDLQVFSTIERYFNVFPLIVAALIAPYLVRKHNNQFLLYCGISFLGLAYVFSFLEGYKTAYFLIQTTLQVGWGFVDVFMWIIAMYIAKKENNPRYITMFIAVFLTGTFLGSVTNVLAQTIIQHDSRFIFNLLTNVPLFLAVVLLGNTDKQFETVFAQGSDAEGDLQGILKNLTLREKEVANLILKRLKNEEISETLYISPNTLKTHLRNIYKKTQVKNKEEFIKTFTKE